MVNQSDYEGIYKNAKDSKSSTQSAYGVAAKGALKTEIDLKSVMKATKLLEKAAKNINKIFDDVVKKITKIQKLSAKTTKADAKSSKAEELVQKQINVTAKITEVIPPIENAEINVTAKIEDVLPPDFVATIPVTGQPVDMPDMGGNLPDFQDSKASLDEYLKKVNDADLSMQPQVAPLDHKALQDQFEDLGFDIPAHLADIDTTMPDMPDVKVPAEVVPDTTKLEKALKKPAKVKKKVEKPQEVEIKADVENVEENIKKAVTPLTETHEVPIEPIVKVAEFKETTATLDKLRDKFKDLQKNGDVASVADSIKELQAQLQATALDKPALANQLNEIIGKKAEIKDREASIVKLNEKIAKLKDQMVALDKNGDVSGMVVNSKEIEATQNQIEEITEGISDLDDAIATLGPTATDTALSAYTMTKGFNEAAEAQLKLLNSKDFGHSVSGFESVISKLQMIPGVGKLATKSAMEFQEALSDISSIEDNLIDLRREAEIFGEKLRKAITDKDTKKVKEYSDGLNRVNKQMIDLNKELKTLKHGASAWDDLKSKVSSNVLAFASAGASLAFLNSALEQSIKYSNYLTESALDMGQQFDWNNQTFEVAGVKLTGATAAYAKATAEIAKMNKEGQTWGLTQEESMKLSQDLKKKALIPQGEAVEEAAHQYLALAKTMRVDVNTAMEIGQLNMRKFGVTAEESMKIMANTAMTWNKGSDAIHKSSIRLEDYRGMMDKVTDSNVHASQNTRVLNQLMINQLDRMKQLGASDKDAMEATEALSKAIGNAPDWIKWEVGADMYRDLGQQMSKLTDKDLAGLEKKYSEHAGLMNSMQDKEKKTFLALEEKYGKEVSAEQLSSLAKMVNNDKMPMELRQKNMESFLGATEAGMEATGNRIAKFSLEAGTESMQKDLGLTAVQAGLLWQQMSEAKDTGKDAGKVFSTMMKGFKKEAKDATTAQGDLNAAVKQGEAAQGPDLVKGINEAKGTLETLLNNPLTKAAIGIASGIGAVAAMGVSAATGMAQLFYLKKIADASGGGGLGGAGGAAGKASGVMGKLGQAGAAFAVGAAIGEVVNVGLEKYTQGETKEGFSGDIAEQGMYKVSKFFGGQKDNEKQLDDNKRAEDRLNAILKMKKDGITDPTERNQKLKEMGLEPIKDVPPPPAGMTPAMASTAGAGAPIAVPQTKSQSSLSTPEQKAAVKTATKAAVETAVRSLPDATPAAGGAVAGSAKTSSSASTGGGGGLEGSAATLLPNGDVAFTVKGFDQILSQFQGKKVRSTM